MNATAALLQLPTLSINDPKLESYAKEARASNCDIIALGEFVLNDFKSVVNGDDSKASDSKTRKNLESKKNMMAEIGQKQLNFITKLAKKHKIAFLAPLLLNDGEKGKLFKVLAFVDASGNALFYHQQRLINYPHWDENAFFDNKKSPIKTPLIFELNGIKCAALFGFEIHFDELWLKIKKSGASAVFMPTACCFDSNLRWKNLSKMRAFLNSLALFRINRVGDELIAGSTWKFYGESLAISPAGEVSNALDYKEGMLVAEINLDSIETTRQSWGFR